MPFKYNYACNIPVPTYIFKRSILRKLYHYVNVDIFVPRFFLVLVVVRFTFIWGCEIISIINQDVKLLYKYIMYTTLLNIDINIKLKHTSLASQCSKIWIIRFTPLSISSLLVFSLLIFLIIIILLDVLVSSVKLFEFWKCIKHYCLIKLYGV